MNPEQLNNSLFSFIKQSPTPFHAAAVIRDTLVQEGFILLDEGHTWNLENGEKYVVVRHGALIAFTVSDFSQLTKGFRIIGAHTDSPSLQLKPQSSSASTSYFKIGVEKYGGALLHTWFDRELSLAGNVTAQCADGSYDNYLLDFESPILYIPSLAIHLERKANEGREINVQNDLSPIFAQNAIADAKSWNKFLVERINSQYPDAGAQSVEGHDLFCYDCAAPGYFGVESEFISAPRLDNLLSCYVGLQAILSMEKNNNCMLIFSNHEEIGSTSYSGALGNFGNLVLARICTNFDTYGVCLHNSFLLSLDNAHATHPNFLDKNDPDHEILLNHGPVIKLNSSQRYCSNAKSGAIFRIICAEAGVTPQDFVMRSDMLSGSTIGPLATAELGVQGIDVGAPTWAMHSIREVTGATDPELLYRSSRHFFEREALPSIGKI